MFCPPEDHIHTQQETAIPNMGCALHLIQDKRKKAAFFFRPTQEQRERVQNKDHKMRFFCDQGKKGSFVPSTWSCQVGGFVALRIKDDYCNVLREWEQKNEGPPNKRERWI